MSNANLVMEPTSRDRVSFLERFYEFFVSTSSPSKPIPAQHQIALSRFPDLKEFLRPTFR